MKRVLIVSPHFPPVNTADMHRIRQSLPYFKEMGWEPVIITVEEKYIEAYSVDPLLVHTVPSDIEVHKVGAWNAGRTRKFGLGSLSMRSYFHFQRKGDELLGSRHFDLVYFSTTAFHVMALGPRWKRKFGVPFILDIQDPWRSDFYLDKPKSERPPKFRISYTIDKYLEAATVPRADGIISVSRGYCDVFLQRYSSMREQQFRVIPFGASIYDLEIMKKFAVGTGGIELLSNKKNIVYIGRGGHDLQYALELVFRAFRRGLESDAATFSPTHFWFIGTSYAPPGQGCQTILPVARQHGVDGYVTEIPDRLPYFNTLSVLEKADALLVPGSTDTSYTASKIYPYIMTERPLLAIFHKKSSVVKVLREINFGKVVVFTGKGNEKGALVDECLKYLEEILRGANAGMTYDREAFETYTAKAMTRRQVEFFNSITISHAP